MLPMYSFCDRDIPGQKHYLIGIFLGCSKSEKAVLKQEKDVLKQKSDKRIIDQESDVPSIIFSYFL